ncbi:hypothetical protein Tco_0889336 [Tanacetum coccineum]
MKDLNNHIAFLKKIFDTLKEESSERYEKNISEIMDLENAKKKVENIVFKVGQSTQTMHMLTKPQNYDETHKTTLGYQNLLYLSQARRKQPSLYNGYVLIAKEHNPVSVCDSEETLILAEESRLKMLENPPVNVSKPKVFPKKLPSTSQVRKNLNNARDLLTKFDECIKKRTTLSPYEIGFITEVKEMKDIFKQMEEEVDQCSMAKKSFEIGKKQLLINNDRLLQVNIASDIMGTYLRSLNEVDNCGKCWLIINNQFVEINNLKVQVQDKLHVINELKHLLAQKSQKTQCELPVFDSKIQKIEDENVSLAFQVSSLVKEREHRTKLYSVTLFPKSKVIPKVVEKNDLSKSVTSHLTTNKIIEKCTKVLALGLLKIETEPINAYIKNNKVVHRDYLRVTKEHVATLQKLLEQARALKPLDEHIGYASKFAAQIQELLVYVSTLCPFTQSGNEKWALPTSNRKNNKPFIDASRTKQTIEIITKEHAVKQNTRKTNNTMLPSTGRVSSTNARGS